ncbi:uncharacterized protein LOC130428419 isoform X4 [Triplophysa dalaica]|uniref:uncharacterized protein LOC130428419 isoform X4 n=1 Tax=Triplophysa dalaica TaxID=1582913 RepID=UPI0024E01E9E|nr:uncharacterized protein LOC130428419 isoform X4 [Triplophysa dalaica]
MASPVPELQTTHNTTLRPSLSGRYKRGDPTGPVTHFLLEHPTQILLMQFLENLLLQSRMASQSCSFIHTSEAIAELVEKAKANSLEILKSGIVFSSGHLAKIMLYSSPIDRWIEVVVTDAPPALTGAVAPMSSTGTTPEPPAVAETEETEPSEVCSDLSDRARHAVEESCEEADGREGTVSETLPGSSAPERLCHVPGERPPE